MYSESPCSSCGRWLHMPQSLRFEIVLQPESIPKTPCAVRNIWDFDKSGKTIPSENLYNGNDRSVFMQGRSDKGCKLCSML